MYDFPLGKILTAVEGKTKKKCSGCSFGDDDISGYCGFFECSAHRREDGKDVIYKLVDLPEEKRKLIDAMREVCNEDCPNHNDTVIMDDDKITCDRCGILLLTDKLGINRIGEDIAR